MKKKNQFDSKDMMLLVAALIVIYLVVSWFGNSGEPFDYAAPPSAEISQSAEPSEAP